MGLVQNLKKIWKIMERGYSDGLSSPSIKQKAKQTSKKPDNSLSTESLQKDLTQEDQHTTIATSSTGTSEKITMMETEDIVAHVRQWAIDAIDSKVKVEEIYDQLAIIDEFHEWLNPKKDLEIVSIDEISEEEYNNYIDGVERS